MMDERSATARVSIVFTIAIAICVMIMINVGGCQLGSKHCANAWFDANGGLVILVTMLFSYLCAYLAI